jgi:hypothetical protein
MAFPPLGDAGHPQSNARRPTLVHPTTAMRTPSRRRGHRVVIAVAFASSAAYAATALAIASLAGAWAARGQHLLMLVPAFRVEGSDVIHPATWVSDPSNFRPAMAEAAMSGVVAGVAAWGVVRLRRHTSAQDHSMRRGLLWGVPLVLVVGPAIFAPMIWLLNSISFG